VTGEQIRDACRAVVRPPVRGMVEFSGPVYDGGGSRLAASEDDALAEIRRLVALAGGWSTPREAAP